MSGLGTQAAGGVRAAQLRSEKGRLIAIALVAGGLAAGVAVAGASGGSEPRVTLQPAALAAQAAPLGSQSSSWFCPGGTGGTGGTARPEGTGSTGTTTAGSSTTILLANGGPHLVTGVMHAVDAKGVTGEKHFAIPAGGQIQELLGTVVGGPWLAARLDVKGGGVVASERVAGQWGSSVSTCSSETSPRWYFAQGTTVKGASLDVSVFNPTANLAVVDLTFLTASGIVSPAPDQGLVIGPGKLMTVTVGKYVQDKSEIATIVTARSGAVTAAELQRYSVGGVVGTSLVLGTPAAVDVWELPQLTDAPGGASDLEVLNPSASTPAHVQVAVRLATGPVAPFDAVVAPSSVWTLETSKQLRIPVGTDYSVQVRATGVPGVVVGRLGEGPAQSPAPQWGSQAAIAAPFTASSTHWIVPAIATVPAPATTTGTTAPGPGTSASASATSKDLVAASDGVVLFQNPGRATRRASLFVMTASGSREVGVVRVPAHGTATFGARGVPLLVEADGPLAIEAMGSSRGAAGVDDVVAVPQR